MRPRATNLLLLLGLSLLVFALAGPAGAASWRGVVVGQERARHALLIADKSGTVRAVRVGAAFRLAPGARVSLSAGRLADGTFRIWKVRALGRAGLARVRGTVVRTGPRSYVLAAGTSVLVVRYWALRTLAVDEDELEPGDDVITQVSIGQGGALAQQAVQTIAQSAAQGAELEVTGVLTTLTLNNPTVNPPTTGLVEVTVQQGSSSAKLGCAIPASFSANLSSFLPKVGKTDQLVEMECELVNGQWALESLALPGQDEVEDEDEDNETEVTGLVTALSPATATATGSIAVDPDGSGAAASASCIIPAGFDTLGVKIGDTVEVECAGSILRELELEDQEEEGHEDGSSSDAGED